MSGDDNNCSTDLAPVPLVARLVEAGHNDELEDAAEDEDHAGQHPDVQEGDVGHPGHALPVNQSEVSIVAS